MEQWLGAKDTQRAIARCLSSGLTPFLHSSPGEGKSGMVATLAEASGLECRTLTLSLLQPEDLRLPRVDGDVLRWTYTSDLPRPSSGGGVLFLDEFPQGSETVQSVFGQLILAGTLDGFRLPSNWGVILAGNLSTDGAATHAVPTQIRNRVCHLYLRTTLSEWAEYDPADSAPPETINLPKDGKMTDSRPHPFILAVLKVRPASLDRPENWQDLEAFATKRTLSLASGYLFWAQSQNRPLDDIDWAIVAGLLGAPAASEIRAISECGAEIPTLEEVMRGGGRNVQSPAARWLAILSLAPQPRNNAQAAAVLALAREWGTDYLVVAWRTIGKEAKRAGMDPTRWKAVVDCASVIQGLYS